MIDWPKNMVMEKYYNWLCDLIGVKQMQSPYKGVTTYYKLAENLFNTKFEWYVPNDDNRAFEGRNLREIFCEDLDIDYEYDEFPEEVSLLEVVIGLAYRCEGIMIDQIKDMGVKDWFWKMMDNAGFSDCSDEYYDNPGVADFVDAVLANIVNRTYKRNGKGGLFPLKNAKKDQRKVELWYQMNTYLVENYYTDDAVV